MAQAARRGNVLEGRAVTAAIYVLALIAAGVLAGALTAALTVALSLTPRQVYQAYRKWFQALCVVLRFQDRRS